MKKFLDWVKANYKKKVPPVIAWSVFGGAVVVAVALALIICL